MRKINFEHAMALAQEKYDLVDFKYPAGLGGRKAIYKFYRVECARMRIRFVMLAIGTRADVTEQIAQGYTGRGSWATYCRNARPSGPRQCTPRGKVATPPGLHTFKG